ncbi:MAG TPA: S8 family serine peptidase [bacterium]|nr:S8 family serine peptidase [bacterium]
MIAAAFSLVALANPCWARPWIHDQDENKIDDRIERVHELGRAEAFVGGDVNGRRRIALYEEAQRSNEAEFGIYIGYRARPGNADLDELRALGLTILKPYLYIDYVRSQATFAQIQALAGLSSVARIEAIPMMYATNHWGSRVVRARDSRGLSKFQNYVLFPSGRQELQLDGTGVVVAVLDTGVNDAPDALNPGYPGHESLQGKFLGGGEFYFGNPLFNTPLNQSMNPQDHGGAASSYHATHVAGTAIGTGGQDAFFAGVAPNARLVDCKVLSDGGAGFGSADGVEWCIANKTNTWGLSGADLIYSGIDVLNLSLGGTDASDGTDASSQMINAAVDAGLICCVATGNDDAQEHISSPAAADKCIAVGATSHAQSLDRADDLVTSFSNEGPRTDDGDADHLDEMKPSVVAPGANIFSAEGDFLSEGRSYKSLSGTSMATPHLAGVCALMRQAAPSLNPIQIRTILQNTAEHNILSEKGDRPNDPFTLDPNYDPGCGWGCVDVYAAALEAQNSASGVQVVQLRAIARPQDGAVDMTWVTQREYSFQGFHVYRADDAGGSPAAFAQITASLVAPSGHSNIQGASNRTPYTFVDNSASLQLGHTYWYRLDWIDNSSVAHPQPPVPATFGQEPALATAHFSIVHNEPDFDLTMTLGVSNGHDERNPAYFALGFPVAEADSTVIHEPANAATATVGYLERFWTYSIGASENIAAQLPPSHTWPWFLKVDEGGYVNRSGRITSFSVFHHDAPGSPTGTLYVTDSVLPALTVETQSTVVWIPEKALSAPGDAISPAATELSAWPNPFADQSMIRYSIGREAGLNENAPATLGLYDVAGRVVRVLTHEPWSPGVKQTIWDGRAANGSVVPPGVYFVKLQAGEVAHSMKIVRIQ